MLSHPSYVKTLRYVQTYRCAHDHEQALRLLLSLVSLPRCNSRQILNCYQASPQEYSHMSKPSPLNRFSLDTWAVLLAFAAALLVRFGLLKTVPW